MENRPITFLLTQWFFRFFILILKTDVGIFVDGNSQIRWRMKTKSRKWKNACSNLKRDNYYFNECRDIQYFNKLYLKIGRRLCANLQYFKTFL